MNDQPDPSVAPSSSDASRTDPDDAYVAHTAAEHRDAAIADLAGAVADAAVDARTDRELPPSPAHVLRVVVDTEGHADIDATVSRERVVGWLRYIADQLEAGLIAQGGL